MLVGSILSCGGDKEDREPTVIAPENHAPVLIPRADTTAAVGDTLRLRAEATDADGDTLLYGLVVEQTLEEIREGYFASASIDGETGAFWFSPEAGDRPGRSFRFTAQDPLGAADTTRFTVNVP